MPQLLSTPPESQLSTLKLFTGMVLRLTEPNGPLQRSRAERSVWFAPMLTAMTDILNMPVTAVAAATSPVSTIQSHDKRLPVIVRNVGVNQKQQVWRKGQRSSWRNVWLLVGQGLSEVT